MIKNLILYLSHTLAEPVYLSMQKIEFTFFSYFF